MCVLHNLNCKCTSNHIYSTFICYLCIWLAYLCIWPAYLCIWLWPAYLCIWPALMNDDAQRNKSSSDTLVTYVLGKQWKWANPESWYQNHIFTAVQSLLRDNISGAQSSSPPFPAGLCRLLICHVELCIY